MRCCCNWSYHPCKNMWFNKGPVSSFCGITALLQLFLCNSIIRMIDCISCSWPSHHFFSVHPENNYHFPLNPISNTLVLLWNKMPPSHPWHQLDVFTLFLSLCFYDWLPIHAFPNQTLRIRSADPSPPSSALLLFLFLSEMNSSGSVLCHCSLIEALDAVFICVFSCTHPFSLPWQAFVFWSPTHCGALTGSAERRSAAEPRPLFLCLFQCSFKAWPLLKSCTSTDIILKRETCQVFFGTHAHGSGHTFKVLCAHFIMIERTDYIHKIYHPFMLDRFHITFYKNSISLSNKVHTPICAVLEGWNLGI